MRKHDEVGFRLRVLSNILYFGAFLVVMVGVVLLFAVLTDDARRFGGFRDYAAVLLSGAGPFLTAACVLVAAAALVQALALLDEAKREDADLVLEQLDSISDELSSHSESQI